MYEPTDAEIDAAFTAAMRHVFGAQFNPTFFEAESARPQWRAALIAAYAVRGD